MTHKDDRRQSESSVNGDRTLPTGDGDVPDFVSARNHVQDELVRFVRALRQTGVQVPANAAITGARALVEVGFEKKPARSALQAALLTRKEDIDTYQRMFPEFWRRLSAGLNPEVADGQPSEDANEDAQPSIDIGVPKDETPAGVEMRETDSENSMDVDVALQEMAPENEAKDEVEETATASTYSRTGTQAPITVEPAQLHERGNLEGALRELTRSLAALTGRRWARGGGPRADTRRALRESFGTGGTIVSVPRKRRKLTAVRCLLLVDVSQSVLDTIDEGFLIRFLRAAMARWRNAKIFFFDDSVREVTAQFDAPAAETALNALERVGTEWGGGTRIGHAIETVRRSHPIVVDRDTVVFVISDGLEVGEIDRLERGMAWVSRRASSVLWLNPLAVANEYEPTCRGMAASLPYIDGLFAFAGPGDIAEIARQLRLQGTGGTIGYEQDLRRHS